MNGNGVDGDGDKYEGSQDHPHGRDLAAEVLARLLRERASREGVWLDVAGDSMGRALPGGSRVLVRAAGKPPRLGQVWAFCDVGGEIMVHRYLRRRAGRHVFGGDANTFTDPAVPPERLIGRVIEVERGTRRQALSPALACWAVLRAGSRALIRRVRALGAASVGGQPLCVLNTLEVG